MEQIAIFLKMTLVTARSNRGAALGAYRELAGFGEGMLPQQTPTARGKPPGPGKEATKKFHHSRSGTSGRPRVPPCASRWWFALCDRRLTRRLSRVKALAANAIKALIVARTHLLGFDNRTDDA